MEIIKLICIGIGIGFAVVIPGVSGGTLAVVFNVYDRLINIITPNIKKILAEWKFLLPLIAGIIIGVVLLSKGITYLFDNYEIQTFWFFIGIILGSIPLIYGKARKPDSALPSVPSIICFVLALAVMVLMKIFRPGEGTDLYTELTPQLFAMLAIGGALAAIAMIIPGISGSFLLLAIGFYRTVIAAVNDLNIPLLVPFAIGAATGLLVGAALVRLLMEKAPKETYGAILGLIVGSVIVIFPGGLGEGAGIIFSILCALAGGTVSFFVGRHSG